MSQNIFPNIDPYVTSGIELAQKLNDFKDAVVSGLIGSSRPAALVKGGIWVKETSTDLELTLFDGTNDTALMSIEKATGAIRFDAEGVTASRYDNSTKLATTEFVRNNALVQFPNLTDSEDLDSLVGNGMYVQSSGKADLDNNYPVVEDGVLLVLGDTGVRTQTYWGADGKTYTRMYSSSTWSPWTNMPEDVVVGPASASWHAIATFDGMTGKKIQSTGLKLSATTFEPVSPDESIYTGAPFRAQSMKYSVWRDGTTGDNAILNVSTATFLELYDDGLNSIAGLTTTGNIAKRYDRFTTLINTSNTPITIKHDSTEASVANERILTHTGSDIVLPPKRAITVRFSQTDLFKWVTLEYITTLDGQTIDGATLTNANITGASIQNPARLDPKKDTFDNLTTYAATAQNGEIVYAIDKGELYTVVGGELKNIGSGAGGSGVSSLNLLEDGSFEEGTDSWIVSSGTIDIDTVNVLATPTNKQCLSASINPFSDLRKFITLNTQYDEVDGEISFLIKASSDLELIVNYDDGVDTVEILNKPIVGNSKWTFLKFPLKFVSGYPIGVFFKPIDEVDPTDILLDEVYIGVSQETEAPTKAVVNIDTNQIDWAKGDIFFKSLTATEAFDFENFENGRVISVILMNETGADINISFGAVFIKKTSDFPDKVEAGKTTVITFISAGMYAFAAQVKELA